MHRRPASTGSYPRQPTSSPIGVPVFMQMVGRNIVSQPRCMCPYGVRARAHTDWFDVSLHCNHVTKGHPGTTRKFILFVLDRICLPLGLIDEYAAFVWPGTERKVKCSVDLCRS